MNRKNLMQYIGNQSQIGYSRHYMLTDGWGKGLREIDVNSGSGLQYTILPDRGMDISLASFKGTNLVYLTCNAETHPSFFEPENLGWLRTFTGGLLTTCGLTYIGGPVNEGGEHLGLHGRYSTIPARQVADLSEWEGDDYFIKIKGTIEEGTIFGNKLRVEREIKTTRGNNIISITDRISNFGFKASPYTILYHMNLGYPLLSEDAELIIDPETTRPRDPETEKAMGDFRKFIKPSADFNEQVFIHTMKKDKHGYSEVTLQNKTVGISLTIRFDGRSLPYLAQWRMMGQGEYVLGLEPANVPLKNRKVLREEKILPFLEPGESTVNTIEVILKEL
jgi:hypothetical protein